MTEKQKRRFYFLTMDPSGPRIPATAAADQVGISRATAYRLTKSSRSTSNDEASDRRKLEQLPSPKSYQELSTDARAALEDFNLFSELFFCRRPSPWRYDAAMRLGELLATPDREFVDVNVFPGAGKTTLVTHDIPAWLIAGGFTLDPAFGRALRMMLGSRVKNVAKHFCLRLRRSLELARPFYDKDQRREAELVMAIEYGRFKPDVSIGEERIWSQEQFLVAQHGDVDLYEKEPTVQAASQESGFLGERVNLAVWDDIAVVQNSTNPDVAQATNDWFEDEAETRVEPGGLLALVGQRLSPLDLHRKRLDARVEDEDGQLIPLYKHIIYPSHHDELCTGQGHTQWTPSEAKGCLTDEYRLPSGDWIKVRSKTNYRTVYQQEDADPAKILVQPVWLEGGKDHEGFEAPGCYDRERGWMEWPDPKVGKTIDYVAVDPSAGNWWVAEWWALQPESRHNYLIQGRRKKLQASQFLDWNNEKQEFSGWMHEMQVESYTMGHPIRVWIIEAVAAHKYLFQFEHFRRWRGLFPNVVVVAHQTQMNKIDPELGVEGLMPNRYRTGMKHLPKKPGIEQLNYLRVKEKELTSYPFADTDDTVMADWIGEWNLDRIITSGRRDLGDEPRVDFRTMPAYLRRQQHEHTLV